MSNVSLQQNGYVNSLQPEIRKTTKQPEFSALDKEQIKQDAVELAQQGHEAVKENWIFSTMRNVFHIEDPKKFLTSLGLTLATVVGLAFLGNKSTNKMTKLGQKVDDLLANNKLYQNTAQNLNNLKNKTVSTLRKSKTLDDVFETLKTRKATPKADLTRGYGRGFVSIFSLTPVDIIKTALNKKQAKLPQELASQLGNKNTQKFMELFRSDSKAALDTLKKLTNDETKAQEIFNNLTKADDEVLNSIKKLVGENKAKTFFNQITGLNEIKDNRKFCSELTNAIIDNFNLKNSSGKTNKKALMSFFEGLPMSLIECMSFSVVPVTTPVGSISEIVREEENGLFIKVKDSDSISHQIDRLNNNRDLLEQLSMKAREYIFSHFNTDMYINRLNKTYADSSLIGGGKNHKQIIIKFFSVIIKASLAIPYLADKLLAVCYKKCMRHCGKGVYIRPLSSDFKGLENLSIGDYTSIPKHSTFYCTGAPLTIGKKVIFGPAPTIITGDHRIDVVGKFIMDSHDKLPENDARVVIEDDVWCGSHVTILKGVTIGRGSVIAAGAVVTKSCPPYSIIGGVPAKVLKSRFTPEEIARHEQALYS